MGVGPAVSLRRTSAGLLLDARHRRASFAGRLVQLQRRTAAGRWVTIKRLRLNARSASAVTFRAALPHGTSTLRDRDERQPGRCGLPGRLQPDDRLPPRLSSRHILRWMRSRTRPSRPARAGARARGVQPGHSRRAQRTSRCGFSSSATASRRRTTSPRSWRRLPARRRHSEIAYRTIAPGGVSLEDHWVAGRVPAELATGDVGRGRHAAGAVVAPREPGQPARVGGAVRRQRARARRACAPHRLARALRVTPSGRDRSYANAAKAARAELYPAGLAWQAAVAAESAAAALRPRRLPPEPARHVPDRARRARRPHRQAAPPARVLGSTGPASG